MKASFTLERNVVANCPDCGAPTTFEYRSNNNEFGSIAQEEPHHFGTHNWPRKVYTLVRCAGCGRGGLVQISCHGSVREGVISDFFPISVANALIPKNTPLDLQAEYREAEKCISFGAWRAASALLRSTLEKTLIANGYDDAALQAAGKRKNLKERIDLAGDDGAITSSRRQRAQDDIRVLGNDVLHEEWRKVTEEEVLLSHHYIHRILEDFYDDRPTVESLLVTKGRIPPPAATTP